MLRVAKTTVGRTATNGLLWSIVTALVLGTGLALAAQWALRRYIKTNDVLAAPIDITKLALTVVAGVGAVVALVVAYRRQRDLEQGRFVERFGAAAAQLGNTDVAIRIAGVYAMAGAADESRGLRRQQCIDVLCGYLRLPYDTEHGTSGRTKFIVKAPRVDHGRVRGETEEHVEYRQNDREVRATILRVIAGHLRPRAEYSWSRSDFDFRTAHLEDVDFGDTTFSGYARFENATFSGITRFWDTEFDTGAHFDGATFSGIADFRAAKFSRPVSFEDARFSGTTVFNDAKFYASAHFDRASFSDAWFNRAKFRVLTYFRGATFSGPASFEQATFPGAALYEGVTFSDAASFEEVTFSGVALFDGATFSGGASFLSGNFGTRTVSFAEPKQWGPPAPRFDWGEDTTQKPANVEPQDWPPPVTPIG